MHPDAAFFADHPDRRYRIREPADGEFEAEFRSLGDHDVGRRRVIAHRPTPKSPMARALFHMTRKTMMAIPMLLFADESIEDTDEVLAPVFHGIMEEARKRGGDVVHLTKSQQRIMRAALRSSSKVIA